MQLNAHLCNYLNLPETDFCFYLCISYIYIYIYIYILAPGYSSAHKPKLSQNETRLPCLYIIKSLFYGPSLIIPRYNQCMNLSLTANIIGRFFCILMRRPPSNCSCLDYQQQSTDIIIQQFQLIQSLKYRCVTDFIIYIYIYI